MENDTPTSSFLRRQESISQRIVLLAIIAAFTTTYLQGNVIVVWIPACAGMTKRESKRQNNK